MNASKRLTALDSLRGIAALSVVLFHYTCNFHQRFGHPEPPPFSFALGRYGVPLFFMISGFVILMTLNRSENIFQFTVSRFSRLYPVYWVSVITTFCVVSYFGLPGFEASYIDALVNLTMVQTVFEIRHVDHVYWSLWVELKFYVLMGTIFWLGIQRYLMAILMILITGYTVGQLFDFFNTVPGWWRLIAYTPIEYLPYFLFGIVLYEAHENGFSFRLKLMALFCFVATFGNLQYTNIVFIFFLMSVIYVAVIHSPAILQCRFLVFFGTISYATYLIHNNIGRVILLELYKYLHTPSFAILLTSVLCLLLATFLTFAVERPAMRVLRSLQGRFL